MLTDEVKIKVMAGKGGDGIVTFDKVKMSLGPTGGRGGNGGNVYVEGVTNLAALNKYRHKKEWWAENGQLGKGNRSDGKEGEDLILTVPIGTVVHNLNTKEDLDITKPGERILVAKGGIGGRGNFYFRSSKNTTPMQAEKGKPGQELELFLELRLIADIGLIGFPNAGKSSLLNELTKAQAKVANYEFTTLEPNLGVMDGVILADIPGLIEGASTGKGLGIKFLKHIQRTRILAHCLSLESTNPTGDYKAIRAELKSFDPEMTNKKEIIILTKSDMISDPKILTKKIKEMKKISAESGPASGGNPTILSTSIHDWESLENLRKKLQNMLDER